MPAIPDRWLNYKPLGKRIEGTRFIAFKVPLREDVLKTVEKHNRLDGDSLLRDVPNLGLIIDLTNTNRYYDPEFFRRAGVEHIKLMIPGHVTPPTNLVDKFKLYVMSFLNKNKDNDKLIGVHCTHGVNRTGYLICNFMISELIITPKEAIHRFDAARGHQIERSNYLQSLQQLSEGSIKSSSADRIRRSISDKDAYNKNVRIERNSNGKSYRDASNDRAERHTNDKRYHDATNDRTVRNSNGQRYRDASNDRAERHTNDKRYYDTTNDRTVRNSNGKRYRDASNDRAEHHSNYKRYRAASIDRGERHTNDKRYRDASNDRAKHSSNANRHGDHSNSYYREEARRTEKIKPRVGGDDYQCSYGREARDTKIYQQRNVHNQPRATHTNRFREPIQPHGGNYNRAPTTAAPRFRAEPSYEAAQTHGAYKRNPFSSDNRSKHEIRSFDAAKRYETPRTYVSAQAPDRPQRFSAVNQHRTPYSRNEHSYTSNKFDRNQRQNRTRPYNSNFRSTRN